MYRTLSVFFGLMDRVASSRQNLLLENLALCKACGPAGKRPAAEAEGSRSGFLDDPSQVLAGLEAGPGARAAGHGHSLASRRFQARLGVALAAYEAARKKVHLQGSSRADLPHGERKPHVGSAAHSVRTQDARLRHLRTDRAPLDADSLKIDYIDRAPKTRCSRP
jgi:hypothetical protein